MKERERESEKERENETFINGSETSLEETFSNINISFFPSFFFLSLIVNIFSLTTSIPHPTRLICKANNNLRRKSFSLFLRDVNYCICSFSHILQYFLNYQRKSTPADTRLRLLVIHFFSSKRKIFRKPSNDFDINSKPYYFACGVSQTGVSFSLHYFLFLFLLLLLGSTKWC